VRGYQALEDGRGEHVDEPGVDRGEHDAGHLRLELGEVAPHVAVVGEEAKGFAVGQIGDDVECEELGFAGKVKGLVRLDVFLDEGDQGADVAVDAWLEAFDFFA